MRTLVVAAVFLGVGAVSSAQTELFTRIGDAANDQFGSSAAAVGDVDNDGASDFAVGAPFADVVASNAGLVRVYSGRTLGVLFEWRGSAANDAFGASIAGAGDLDNDGNDDVLVGAPRRSAGMVSGYVTVFSGATGLPLYTLTGPTGTWFGHSVASGGDLDGDLIDDLLVGAPRQTTNAQWDGRLHVFSGATGAPVRTHDGNGDLHQMGWAAAFLGDLDGDGRNEYAGGAPGYVGAGALPVARVFDGASGTTLWTNTGALLSDQLGWSFARIADITGDGKDDVLVGAPQDPGIGCACSGKGYVRALNGVTGALVYQLNGQLFYTGLGFALAVLGDIDGNGYEDFVASQPGTEGCGGGSGFALRVYEGSTGALLLTVPSVDVSSEFGWSLASTDANGDGLRDLIVGAPCSNANGSFAGAAHVYTIVRSVVTYCTAETNSLGCTPSIAGVGTPSATLAQVFDVRATSMLNNKSGLLFYGFKPRKTPFQGGSMCVVAPTLRTAIQGSGGTAPPINDCTGVFTLDFNARIQSGVDPLLVAGEEVFAQYWSRDPADASTTNLTDALAFDIKL